MELEEILEMWSSDAELDESELGRESSRIPVLHHKYYKVLARENLVLEKMKADLIKLRHEKSEFYSMGPTKEQHDRGWRLPPRGKILRSEVKEYLESDSDVIEETLAVAYQREKVEALKDILKMIHARQWHVGHAVSDMKFKAGIG